MRYKAQYKPSELLDPVAYQWVPLDACVPLLDEKKYTTFLPPADGTSKKGGDKPEKVTDAELAPMMIFHEDKVVQVRVSLLLLGSAIQSLNSYFPRISFWIRRGKRS
jgi:hypothetical protein